MKLLLLLHVLYREPLSLVATFNYMQGFALQNYEVINPPFLWRSCIKY
jgi:hypothetical protein